jgi:polyisoprenoid-binding protein YceI
MRPASAERVGFDDRLVTAYTDSNGVDAPHEERSLRRDLVVMACARLPSAMSDSSVVIDARAGDDLSAIGGEWELDPSHSALEFVARYAMFTLVRGRFTSFSGEIGIDPTHPGATSIAVDIDASSIDSAMPMRDQHLLGEDFLDAEHHPTITFRARGATLLAAGRYTVRGELTIRGIAQPVWLVVELFGRAPDVLGNPRLGFKVTGKLQRTRWNITWNAPILGGGVVLDDDVDVELDVSLVPAGTLARLRSDPD